MKSTLEWSQQFEIIKDKMAEILSESGQNFSIAKLAAFLDLKKGKVQAWSTGQRPNADDLELIARKLDFSAHWLLLKEGNPFGASVSAEAAPSTTPLTELGKELQDIKTTLETVGASETEIKQALLDYVSGARTPQEQPIATGTDDDLNSSR